MIASYNRVDNLLQIAAHLRRSIYVKEILVVWNNPDVSLRDALLRTV
mgnify:CR=1